MTFAPTDLQVSGELGCIPFTQTTRVGIGAQTKNYEIWFGGRTTRYKVYPDQHNRSKRVEKLHRLKSHPISPEAFRTEGREPFSNLNFRFSQVSDKYPGSHVCWKSFVTGKRAGADWFFRQGPLPQTARGLFPSVFPG